MHPDPKKVQGITEMTAPTDKQQLQSFLRHGQLHGNIHTKLVTPHGAAKSNAEKRQRISLGGATNSVLSENQST